MSAFSVPVIALSGPAGSGKTTAAEAILKRPGYVRLPLAGPIKRMLREGLGLTAEHTDGALKETPVPRLGGYSPRRLLQTLGTDWGRALDPEFWLRIWLHDAHRAAFEGTLGIVVDDVRFLNEASFLKRETDARLISLVTPYESPLGAKEQAHASELELGAILSQADHIIQNRKRSIPDFQLDVLRACDFA